MNLGGTSYNYLLIASNIIKSYWLLGFIDGEGRFGFKNLFPYFQLEQHAKNLFVLEIIIKFIKNIPI